jgi:hypothetical protein
LTRFSEGTALVWQQIANALTEQSGKLDACGEWNRGGDHHHRLNRFRVSICESAD